MKEEMKVLANRLNGNTYGNEYTESDISYAKEHKLLIITGASDDLVEFSGYYEDEGGCYGGGIITFDKDGVSQDSDDIRKNELRIFWCKKQYKDTRIITWSYEVDISCERFLIYEDEDIFSEGIIIDVEDLL